MNREEIIKALIWELMNYHIYFGTPKIKSTEKTAEHILNLCAGYYGDLQRKRNNQK